MLQKSYKEHYNKTRFHAMSNATLLCIAYISNGRAETYVCEAIVSFSLKNVDPWCSNLGNGCPTDSCSLKLLQCNNRFNLI